MHKLESHLQEEKHEAEKLQVQLKALSPIEKMKQSHKQCIAQQHICIIHRKVMEVTEQLQPLQDKVYQLFTEVESRGSELERVVNAIEQCLEGPVNDVII